MYSLYGPKPYIEKTNEMVESLASKGLLDTPSTLHLTVYIDIEYAVYTQQRLLRAGFYS